MEIITSGFPGPAREKKISPVLKNAVVCPDEMSRPEANNNCRAPEEHDGSRDRADYGSCRKEERVISMHLPEGPELQLVCMYIDNH